MSDDFGTNTLECPAPTATSLIQLAVFFCFFSGHAGSPFEKGQDSSKRCWFPAVRFLGLSFRFLAGDLRTAQRWWFLDFASTTAWRARKAEQDLCDFAWRMTSNSKMGSFSFIPFNHPPKGFFSQKSDAQLGPKLPGLVAPVAQNDGCRAVHVPCPRRFLGPWLPPIFCVLGTEIWVWLKIKQEGLRRFWFMFPLTRLPYWYRFFEPRPYEQHQA